MSELTNKTHLTPRELEVIHCLSLGYSNKEIAEGLGISVKTVEIHIQHIILFAGCTARRLVRWCVLYELSKTPPKLVMEALLINNTPVELPIKYVEVD